MSTRDVARLGFGLGMSLAAAWGFAACGSESAAGLNFGPDAGALATRDPLCQRTQDCEANRLCQPARGESVSRCQVPTGRCTPERVSVDCYPDARCETGSSGEGACSFRPPVRMVFSTSSAIALERPNRESDLPVGSGVLLQWSPLRGVSGAVTVAAIMDATPTLDVNTGRILNHQNVRWIWSSAEPGGPVMEGTVPLRYGRAGVDRNGLPGPMYNGDTLPQGLYYWFVFSTVRGAVVASSVAQSFRVGLPVPDLRTCSSVSDCFESAADALLFDCVDATCRRRCASDVDCETGACALSAAPPRGGRRGAYCTSPSVPVGDGGVATRGD
ncbi:MAG: hypothetical protein U0325_10645 [Polyangiales bacterium]